jgi:DNA-binding SARP family transcriptional activator
LLDGFELRLNGEEVDLPLSAQRVVAFLALRDRSLTRMYVAACLWLEASEERGRANLRSALWRLNQPGQSVVEASATHLRLGREVFVDVASLVSTARRLLREAGSHDDDGELDERSLAGELLPDWYDDWVLEERDRLHELRLHALEVLSARLAKEGRFGEAVEAALAAVHAEPLRESAQRALINVYLAEGNYSVALRHYRRYRARLHDELGLEPSARMDEVLRGLVVGKVDAQRGAGARSAQHRRR